MRQVDQTIAIGAAVARVSCWVGAPDARLEGQPLSELERNPKRRERIHMPVRRADLKGCIFCFELTLHAPTVSPSIKYFWARKYRITIGIDMMTVIAIM